MSAPQPSDEGGWPLTHGERDWNQWQLFAVLLVTAAATWCYIIGEYVGYYLNLKMGIAAMTAGAMIGMLMVTLAVVPTATRYGIDSIAAARPQFCDRSWIITVFLQYASIIGWNCLLMIFFGKSVGQLLLALGVIEPAGMDWALRIATVLACILVHVILKRGGTGLERVSQVPFFVIVCLGAWMLWVLLVNQSATIAAATPAYAGQPALGLCDRDRDRYRQPAQLAALYRRDGAQGAGRPFRHPARDAGHGPSGAGPQHRRPCRDPGHSGVGPFGLAGHAGRSTYGAGRPTTS